ncbi:protein ZNF783-like isoform X2 [Apteryx rowi]|uniref:protein ZNF783-like isoform X2 n=1 Tax=Apteryx rowi TaxID=308060 RepID=UPI000E1D5229|nr:protein ZNF783-like isoform X2 [Apteryx rowi]
MAAQAIVTFEDVAISFLEDEWNELKEWQKELYKDVTRENYQALISLACEISKPGIVPLAEPEEQPAVSPFQLPPLVRG